MSMHDKIWMNKFQLHLWLNSCPHTFIIDFKSSKELSVSCGKFKLCTTDIIKDQLMFSYQLNVKGRNMGCFLKLGYQMVHERT